MPPHCVVRVTWSCDRQQSAWTAILRRVLGPGSSRPSSSTFRVDHAQGIGCSPLGAAHEHLQNRILAICVRAKIQLFGRRLYSASRRLSKIYLVIDCVVCQGSCRGAKRALSTYLARSAAIATATAPVSSYHDQSQHLPDVSHDDLPIVSQDIGQVAIGWSTREWSRL